MRNWFEKEEDELTKDVNEGRISEAEYRRGMRELPAELQAEADEVAAAARERFMSDY